MFDNPAIRLFAGLIIAGILFSVIMTLMPTYGLPLEARSAIGWLFDTIWTLDFVLPVNTIMYIIGLYLAIDMVAISIKLVLIIKSQMTQA